MNFLKSLYHAHVWHVARVNHWYQTDNTPDYRAWLRAMLYLRLDIRIAELYRTRPDDQSPLFGRDAVNYLTALHTSTPITQISTFSFDKTLLLLNPSLKSTKISHIIYPIPYHIQFAIQDMNEFPHCGLPPCTENEWDSSILKKRLQKM
ncbi:hypothetical protein RJV04_000793 [Salmonella enterica]|nr:hypothetical protein [Salmonella enterica]